MHLRISTLTPSSRAGQLISLKRAARRGLFDCRSHLQQKHFRPSPPTFHISTQEYFDAADDDRQFRDYRHASRISIDAIFSTRGAISISQRRRMPTHRRSHLLPR
jgi:hypothetical protein